MIAGLILFLSLAVLVEFSIAHWRSMWLAVAAQPLSQTLAAATGIADHAISADDFDRLVSTSQQLSPAGMRGGATSLKQVRAYYRVIRALDAICAKQMPALSAWTKRELVLCSRYAAVVLDQRINANLAFASEARNF
jgi:hypothetical protein